MVKFEFGKDQNKLEKMHNDNSRPAFYRNPKNNAWAERRECMLPGGYEYLVIYPNQFSILQYVGYGQVIPRTIQEIVCIH